MGLGFIAHNTSIGSTTPVALSADQAVKTGCRIEALAANGAAYVYFGFFADDASALAGLTASTGYQLAAGSAESIDVGAIQGNSDSSTGNLKYLYLLSSAGTLGVCCWGR